MGADRAGGPIAERIRVELARQRRSRQWLADKARISLSTLEKALGGRRSFTLSTLVRVEDALGLSLRGAPQPAQPGPHGNAPDHLGAYSRAAVAWLENEYIALRPSAGEPGSVYAHRLGIRWDEARGHLVFSESARLDAEFTQSGIVGVSALSGHVYLVTNELGQYRLVILGRPASNRAFHGVLTTLQVGRGTSLMPVTMPFVLLPDGGDNPLAVGRISPGHAAFREYRAHLDRVIGDDFARILR